MFRSVSRRHLKDPRLGAKNLSQEERGQRTPKSAFEDLRPFQTLRGYHGLKFESPKRRRKTAEQKRRRTPIFPSPFFELLSRDFGGAL